MKLIKIIMSNNSEITLKNAKIKMKSISTENLFNNNSGLDITEIKYKYTFEVEGIKYQIPRYSKLETKIRKKMLKYLGLEWIDETDN